MVFGLAMCRNPLEGHNTLLVGRTIICGFVYFQSDLVLWELGRELFGNREALIAASSHSWAELTSAHFSNFSSQGIPASESTRRTSLALQ